MVWSKTREEEDCDRRPQKSWVILHWFSILNNIRGWQNAFQYITDQLVAELKINPLNQMKEWTGEAISMKGFEHISFSVKECDLYWKINVQ